MTSWTTDKRYAERLKGLAREGAVAAAIYCHAPSAGEVIVNIGELWRSSAFTAAAEALRQSHPGDAKALFNFRDRQSEVVLVTPLKGSEIVALSGASSPFDELCDAEGIPEEKRDALFRGLVEAGVYPGELTYPYAAPGVIARTILKFREKLEALKEMQNSQRPEQSTFVWRYALSRLYAFQTEWSRARRHMLEEKRRNMAKSRRD